MMCEPMHSSTEAVTVERLQELWGGNFSTRLQRRIAECDLRYSRLTAEERDAALLEIVNAVMDPPVAAGPQRLEQWERGWNQNLQELQRSGDAAAIVPRYYGKKAIIRWDGDVARPLSDAFERNMISLLVEWALEQFLSHVDTVCDLGCGSGHQLLRARTVFPNKALVGLDWTEASQRIIKGVVEAGLATNIRGSRFNFYEPDEALDMGPNWGIFSVAALEQIGDRHEVLVQYLLRKRPAICVHIEPLDELLDETRLLDRLSVLYAHRRNYLRSFVPRLRELEREGRLRILTERRTWTGSQFIEGHSLVVWAPI